MKRMMMLALALACGGELGESYDVETTGETSDLLDEQQPAEETIEEKTTVKNGYGYNVNRTTGGNYRCQQLIGLDSDKCVYPGFKANRVVCVDCTGMTAGQCAEAKEDVIAILPTFNSQFNASGWSFQTTASGNCGTGMAARIRYADISGSQTIGSILGYVDVSSNISGPLTELTGNPGTHHVQTGTASITVDRARIVADFAVADQQRVRRHALYGGMYAALTGLGFTPEHTNRVTSISTTPGVAKFITVSSKEACRVNSYTITTDGLFSASPQDCP